MIVVYFSITGNVRRFVKNLGLPAIEITPTNPFIEVEEEFVFIAPAYEPEVTDIAWDFMGTGNNKDYCRGVIGSGNVNFDTLYLYTAIDLARDFEAPLLDGFEYFGNKKDVQRIKERIHAITSTSV